MLSSGRKCLCRVFRGFRFRKRCTRSQMPEASLNRETSRNTTREKDFLMNVTDESNNVTITVRVIPRSSRTEIVGEIDGAVKVRVASPPVDGAANTELIRFISKKLGVARSSVSIVSGETSRTKRLRVNGASAQEIRDLLAG